MARLRGESRLEVKPEGTAREPNTVNIRQLARDTRAVIEEVVRSGRPTIITVNGRPQVAVAPLVGALRAAEQYVLEHVPADLIAAIREGEADLIGGRYVLPPEDSEVASVQVDQDVADEPELTGARELETAILSTRGRSGTDETVRNQFRHSEVLALGLPAGNDSLPHGAEIELLHRRDHLGEPNAVPVFTRMTILRRTLTRQRHLLEEQPDLMILRLSGSDLLDSIGGGTIDINSGSPLEFIFQPWHSLMRRKGVAFATMGSAQDSVRA